MLLEFIKGDASFFDLLIFVISVLLAITVHEFAHAVRAHQAGDPTPGRQGRLTLNPIAHYDPIGTTMILAVGLGWGKAVMTQPASFRHPRRDALMVSLWGPLSNILLAIATLLLMRFATPLYQWGPWDELSKSIVIWNLFLAFFNLIPLPPLDGSHVMSQLLPMKQAVQYDRFVGQWGFLILLLLCFSGAGFIDQWVAIPTRLLVHAVMRL
jgi:Zn-dependent protease